MAKESLGVYDFKRLNEEMGQELAVSIIFANMDMQLFKTPTDLITFDYINGKYFSKHKATELRDKAVQIVLEMNGKMRGSSHAI